MFVLTLKGTSSEVELVKGSTLKITTDPAFKERCDETTVYVDYKNISKVMEANKFVFIDDGLISLLVKEVGSDYLITEVQNTGMLGSKKGVNLPDVIVDLPAVSEQDQRDILFGLEQDVSLACLMFIWIPSNRKLCHNRLYSLIHTRTHTRHA